MMSALEGGEGGSRKVDKSTDKLRDHVYDKGGEGVKKFEIFMDVIDGSPLRLIVGRPLISARVPDVDVYLHRLLWVDVDVLHECARRVLADRDGGEVEGAVPLENIGMGEREQRRIRPKFTVHPQSISSICAH